jgi:hypothetical protein
MTKPEVTLENYEAVYNFYEDYRPKPEDVQKIYSKVGKIFRPNVEYAYGAQEIIADALNTGHRLIIVSNHVNYCDPPNIAALAEREQLLNTIVGNTFIPARADLFKHDKLRNAIDDLGAIPIIRAKTIDREDRERNALRRKATERYLGCCVTKISEGQHMAIFPEGTRNLDKKQLLLPVKDGLAKVIEQIDPDIPLALVAVGIKYRERSLRGCTNPDMYIDIPSYQFGISQEDMTRTITNRMRSAALGALGMRQSW